MYRNLSNPDNIITNSAQDGKLISLLVELLNNTDCVRSHNSDSELDWQHWELFALDVWFLLAGTEEVKQNGISFVRFVFQSFFFL